jgi:class 3 adenylate cyclase/predicted ATPase
MRFCGGCGAPLRDGLVAVKRVDADGIAQRRHMTVVFCDLVDSTPLAESLDPEDFREILSAYQQGCVRAIDRLGGYTARYIGDGVVAYFGYPRAHEDDAQRGVHAGLGILQEIVQLNAALGDSHGISLQVRIGIHSGVVVAGEMVAGATLGKHEIVGEMPHVAARLESIAAPGSVVISDATRDFVEGYFETESLGLKALKGMSRPIGVHRVLRSTGAVGRLEVASGRPLTPMIGRDHELARLDEVWRLAESGRGDVAHVTGEAGIGKSRLVRSLLERLGEQVGAVQMWHCSAHHESTSLYPVIRYVERLLGLDTPQKAEVQLKVLDTAVRDAGLDPVESVPLLADLLSIERGRDGGSPSLGPRDARTATLRVLESMLVTNPAHHPLFLVVEDLHWADPTTIELLDRIISSLRDLPVMCVLTFRREFEPPWAQHRRGIEIELGPLTSAEVRAMVAAGSETPPDPAVLTWVDSAADGVPLFVEEMLKMLKLDSGAGAGVPGPAVAAVPPTLEGLLTERLDRLPDLGDVIDVASVLGREFERELLEALEPLGGADLEPALALLAAQGVLRPVGDARSRFEFTHALLQEAAYERLLRRRRHSLHGRVADTLSRSFAAVAEREPELIAHHWSRAAEPAKATAYWHAAGTRALERAAFREAAEHFRRGLEALDEAAPDPSDDHERADFLTHRAASLQAAHGYAAAGVDDAYAAARSACWRARDDDRLVAVIRGQWMFYLLRGQYGRALDLANEMLALGERADDLVRLAEGHLYRGLVNMYTADFEHARWHLGAAFTRYRRPDRSDQIYDAQGDTGVGALAYNAVVLWNLGYAEESRERSERSLELAEQVGGEVTRAQAWGMRSILHLTRAEPAEFSRWVEKSRAHSIEHNVGYWRIVSALFSGWLQGRAGELDAGIRRVQESLEEYTSSGSRLSLPHFHILLADLLLAAGDQRRALDVLRAGEEYVEATGERFSESELYRFKGRALLAGDSPDLDGATAAFERAVTVAREQNAKLLELRAANQLAAHQRKLGDGGPVLVQLGSLCDWFGPESELPDVARARALLGLEAPGR